MRLHGSEAKTGPRLLVVDDRWTGEHGIGRFSTEVVSRLTIPWRPLGGGESPSAPTDVLNPGRLRLRSTDVVYSPGFNAGITRGRQLLNIHDLIHLQIESEKSFAKSAYYATVVRWAVRHAGVVMTDSQASARAIVRWVRAPEVQVVVVGCGRSPSFVPVGESTTFDHPTFIYVGNLKPHKNVDVLFDAIALRPDYRLLIVTGHPEKARSKASERGVGHQVSVLSGVTDDGLATMYRGASGALQPSLLEGFGLPALEAMSCGTRVAFWKGCESVEEICDGTGVSVESATAADEWALALDELVVLDS